MVTTGYSWEFCFHRRKRTWLSRSKRPKPYGSAIYKCACWFSFLWQLAHSFEYVMMQGLTVLLTTYESTSRVASVARATKPSHFVTAHCIVITQGYILKTAFIHICTQRVHTYNVVTQKWFTSVHVYATHVQIIANCLLSSSNSMCKIGIIANSSQKPFIVKWAWPLVNSSHKCHETQQPYMQVLKLDTIVLFAHTYLTYTCALKIFVWMMSC